MHEKGLRFSSDIQWVTQPWHSKPDPQLDALLGARCVPKVVERVIRRGGVQSAHPGFVRPLAPLGGPNQSMGTGGLAAHSPYGPHVTRCSRATLIPMDTYYGSTGRVLDALDFYAARVAPSRLGLGLSTQEPTPSYDGFVARFHAITNARVRELDMFVMPLNETWLPWLRKWKNGCRGCPNGGVLSCWANVSCF